MSFLEWVFRISESNPDAQGHLLLLLFLLGVALPRALSPTTAFIHSSVCSEQKPQGACGSGGCSLPPGMCEPISDSTLLPHGIFGVLPQGGVLGCSPPHQMLQTHIIGSSLCFNCPHLNTKPCLSTENLKEIPAPCFSCTSLSRARTQPLCPLLPTARMRSQG